MKKILPLLLALLLLAGCGPLRTPNPRSFPSAAKRSPPRRPWSLPWRDGAAIAVPDFLTEDQQTFTAVPSASSPPLWLRHLLRGILRDAGYGQFSPARLRDGRSRRVFLFCLPGGYQD
jgi:hypothetical protein